MTDPPGFFGVNLTDVVQILFWIVAGTLAVLTYRQARTTLFQPLRVEVFKLEVALLIRLGEMFAQKQEIALRAYFDLHSIVQFNAGLMVERYAATAFDLHPPAGEDLRSRHGDVFTGAMVDIDAAQLVMVRAPEDGLRPDPAESAPAKRSWADWHPSSVELTRAHQDAVLAVETILRDPFLPAGLRPLLDELLRTVIHDLEAVVSTLEEAAKKLPGSYPTPESLDAVELAWVSNLWNRQATALEPVTERIVQYGRDYVQTDRAGFTPRSGRLQRSARKFFHRPARPTGETEPD